MEQHIYQNIFDSHAHYNDDAFEADQDEVLQHIHTNGVCAVVNVGCNLKWSQEAVRLAEHYPFCYAAVGIHPSDANLVADGYLEELRRMAAQNKVVAIGEIGLDYHYDDDCPHDIQQRVFEEQLQLAKELDLPVIIHSREATEDTMVLLRRYQPKGVVHCFSGSAETAKEVVRLGMYVGFTGVLTFSNAKRAKKAVEAVPVDRLLLETDCPYMAPVPFRGKRCTSDLIAYTAEAMAEIKGLEPQQMIDAANANTCRLFGIAL